MARKTFYVEVPITLVIHSGELKFAFNECISNLPTERFEVRKGGKRSPFIAFRQNGLLKIKKKKSRP